MNKKVETFLKNHQFYQYRQYEAYLPTLKEQVDSALSKHNQNQIFFEHTWAKVQPQDLPQTFLSIDLGGMYLRLHHCQIQTGKLETLKTQKIAFYQAKTYTPEILFTDLKHYLDKFTADLKDIPKQLVFSFANALKPAFRKKNHLDGEILFWGKNHRQEGLIGLHLGRELEKYLQQNGYPDLEIHVINDSSTALLAAKLKQKTAATTILNLIVGSGTNISVGYNHKNCFKLINLEFGNLDFFPYSNFDYQLNHQSSTPNRFRTEKLFTGAWQNTLFQIILDRVNSEGLCDAHLEQEKLKKLSSEELEQYFQQKDSPDSNFHDLKFIWDELTRRGAFVCAIGLAAIITHLNKNKLIPQGIVLTEGGAILEHSELFRKTLEKELQEQLENMNSSADFSIEMLLTPEPTCEGAATVLALCQ